MNPGGGVAGLERQAFAGTVPRFHRLWTEAIIDIAAERLYVEVRGGLAGKIQPDVAAHGLAVNLRVGSRRELCGNIARHGLESRARYGPERQACIAADGTGLDVGIPTGQHDIAADGLDLDPLGPHRRKMNIAAHVIGAQVSAALAADIAADRAQLEGAA